MDFGQSSSVVFVCLALGSPNERAQRASDASSETPVLLACGYSCSCVSCIAALLGAGALALASLAALPAVALLAVLAALAAVALPVP